MITKLTVYYKDIYENPGIQAYMMTIGCESFDHDIDAHSISSIFIKREDALEAEKKIYAEFKNILKDDLPTHVETY